MPFTRIENLAEIESVANALEGNTATDGSEGSSSEPVLAGHRPPPITPAQRRAIGGMVLQGLQWIEGQVTKSERNTREKLKAAEEQYRQELQIQNATNNTPDWDVLVQTGRLGSEALQILARTASGSGLKTVAQMQGETRGEKERLDAIDAPRAEKAAKALATQAKDVATIGRLVALHEEQVAKATQAKDVATIGRLVALNEKILADEKDASKSTGSQPTTNIADAARAESIADPEGAALAAGVDAAKAGVSKDDVADLGAMAGASPVEVQAVQAGIDAYNAGVALGEAGGTTQDAAELGAIAGASDAEIAAVSAGVESVSPDVPDAPAPSAGTIDVGTAIGIVSSGGSIDNYDVDVPGADVGGGGADFSGDAGGADFSYDP